VFSLTQQEQALAHSQGGWLSPGVGGGKPVDILQMLTKARSEYDKVGKSSSEPKEIGGSTVLHGNPNLIKPIPVKPNTQVPLTHLLCAHFQIRAGRGGPVGIRGPVLGAPAICPPGSGLSVVADVQASPTTTPHQHPQNQPQHCSAIQKLIQGQRGVVGVGGVLQTVSESPENRLCENGVPLEHHHYHHLHHHLHHQHHHHHQQQYQHQQQVQPDPIQRLFRNQPPALPSTSSSVRPCCSNPPPLQQPPQLSSLPPAQPLLVDSVAYSCSHPQHSQSLFFSPSQPHLEPHRNSQSAPAAHGTGESSLCLYFSKCAAHVVARSKLGQV
uniref:Decapping mRNA 1B n=1 Tax=Myripristis murdjan TaxID=586833 RepID=A0A668APR8_9TELE